MRDLIKIFPAGNSQAACEYLKAVFLRVLGGFDETHFKTHPAPLAAFRIPLAPLHRFEPAVAVIIGIHKRNVLFLGIPNVFRLSDFVFSARMNVGVIKVNGEVYSGLVKVF